MTKAEIINKIVEDTGVDKATVTATLEAFMDAVKGSLNKRENVYLRGFGTFTTKKRAQKVARNISSNTAIVVPACTIPSFKPSKDFVSLIKENTKE